MKKTTLVIKENLENIEKFYVCHKNGQNRLEFMTFEL